MFEEGFSGGKIDWHGIKIPRDGVPTVGGCLCVGAMFFSTALKEGRTRDKEGCAANHAAVYVARKSGAVSRTSVPPRDGAACLRPHVPTSPSTRSARSLSLCRRDFLCWPPSCFFILSFGLSLWLYNSDRAVPGSECTAALGCASHSHNANAGRSVRVCRVLCFVCGRARTAHGKRRKAHLHFSRDRRKK